jgi:adenylyltransferase/sulfurtransferase
MPDHSAPHPTRSVTIRYFAVLRDQRGLASETIETSAATPRALYDDLAARHGLMLGRDRLRVAVNDAFADWDDALAANAYVSFEGWVRDHNEGKSVVSLDYEAFETLANSEGMRILGEAIAKFGLCDAACLHRIGALAIGEMAVWVGVTAAHRGEAFAACRYVIDEIKIRLPVWKREVYADGSVEWVNCQACAAHGHGHAGDEAAIYERQRRLPEVGVAGQARLKQARILVVGAGGLGTAAAQAVAGAGIGHLALCDFDHLEASNLNRQFLYAHADIGKPKAQLAAERLRASNPFIHVEPLQQQVTADNARFLVADYDLVLDCTDNFRARFDLNDACVALGKPLVAASVHRFEGQMLVVQPGHAAGCLRCLWPEQPCLSCGGGSSCADVGIVGAVPAMMGAMQALEAIKLVLGLASEAATHLIVWDGLTQQTTRLRRHRDPACTVCGAGHAVQEASDSVMAEATG